LERLRILIGDEVSRRTRQALLDGVKLAGTILDASIFKRVQAPVGVKVIFKAWMELG
jgi:hypothetical protein